MTHDGLLAQIDAWIQEDGDDYPILGLVALRAVVELTTTYQYDSYVNEEFDQGLQTAFRLVIQAIEKELK